jgi:transcriptional regulator with XRE-family HTH domain
MSKKGRVLDLGSRLGAIRGLRGLSQGTVARLAGMAPSYLSRIETGKVEPTFPTIWRLVGALDTDFEELLGPQSTRAHGAGPCPVTGRGQCLLELIRPEGSPASGACYSPRQVRLLRRFATWLARASPEWVRSMELLLDALEGPRPAS